MLRSRHAVLLPLTALAALAACARQPAMEPAAPAGGAPETPSQEPGLTAAPQGEPAPQAGTPGSARPGTGDDAKVPAQDEGGYASVAEAEAALEKARAELNPPQARDKPAEPARTTQPSPKKPSPSGGSGATELAQGTDRCLNACKAFASLKRAASAVCRLAGESNTRCKRAQTIVQENEARVSVCKCSQNGD